MWDELGEIWIVFCAGAFVVVAEDFRRDERLAPHNLKMADFGLYIMIL